MSFLPKLRYTSSPEKVENIKFFGIDRNEGASEGSFIDSRNMESIDYPYLSSRNPRFYSKLPDGMKMLGIYSAKELCFVLNDGSKSYFYFNGEVKGEWDDAEGKEKFFCEVGGAVYIFPDRKMYRFKNEKAIEQYKASHPRYGEVGEIYIKLAYETNYLNSNKFLLLTNDVMFENGDAVKLWAYDKDTGNRVSLHGLPLDRGIVLLGTDSFTKIGSFRDYYVYKFSGAIDQKYELDGTDTYIRAGYEITYPEDYDEHFSSFSNDTESCEIHKDADGYQYIIFKNDDGNRSTLPPQASNLDEEYLKYAFAEGLSVTFNASDSVFLGVLPESAVIEETGVKLFSRSSNKIYAAYMKFAPDTFTVEDGDWEDDKYVIFYQDDRPSHEAYFTVSANYPSISGAVNVNNRLWGYEGNTIYASSLGKPYIMGAYKGISTDSWALETGIKREFTAVVAYNSIPHYFTEDRIIKVYGSGPSSFQTSETECAGVKKGAGKSIVICSGILFYLDTDGNIVSYTGSYPSVSSRRLDEKFEDAIITADDRYLYCICKTESGDKQLYTYDVLYRIWLIDGEMDAKFAAAHKGTIHFVTENYIISDEESDIAGFEKYSEAGFESMLEFPVTDERLFNMKKLKKVLFKINAERGTSICVEVRETDSPEFRKVFEQKIEGGDEVLTIPVACKRTLGYSVRISGKGKWRLEGIMRRVTIGSYKS